MENLQQKVYRNSPVGHQFQNPLQMSIEKKNRRNKQEYLRMMGQQSKNTSQLQASKLVKKSSGNVPKNSQSQHNIYEYIDEKKDFYLSKITLNSNHEEEVPQQRKSQLQRINREAGSNL